MDSSTRTHEGYDSVDTKDPNSLQKSQLSLATLIDKMLEELPQLSSNCTIYKVPPRHRKIKEMAYTPQRVSIGPLHHGKTELRDMEIHKLRYLQAFLKRAKLKSESFIKAIIEWEERARSCYEDKIDLSSDELVELFLVDSCFIIEIMLRANGVADDNADHTDHLNQPEIIFHIRPDLLLLENQVPFFIISGIFQLAFPYQSPETLVGLSLEYFTDLMLYVYKDDQQLPTSSNIYHFLDLVRQCHLPSAERRVGTEEHGGVLIRNAVALQNAGLNFRIGSKKCLLDITYTSGILEIPKMKINEFSGIILRNLMALEQCQNPYCTNICDYVMFMDMLIDSATDVDILVDSGVLQNDLSNSSETADLINNLAIHADVWDPKFYYWNICSQINGYCDKLRNKWMATLRRDYLSTPWVIASTAAAIILLLLTLVQTICAIISL